MSDEPPVAPPAPDRAALPSRGPARWRRLMVLAVLAGFVAMHGMSADHGVHTLPGLSGDHHAAAAPSDAASDAAAGALVVPAATWSASGSTGAGHGEDGCLVMLAAGVLALVLAAIALRRTGVRVPAPSPRAGHLQVLRGPPSRAAPDFFALGVLRT